MNRSEADKADPQVIHEIDALLLTPFLATADRQALWSAGRRLAGRLAEDPLPPRPEEVPTAAGPSLSGPERAFERTVRLATLLALAGEDVAPLREKLASLQDHPGAVREKERSEAVRSLAKAWSRLLGKATQSTLADDLDRTGSIAPIFADWRNNPIRAAPRPRTPRTPGLAGRALSARGPRSTRPRRVLPEGGDRIVPGRAPGRDLRDAPRRRFGG